MTESSLSPNSLAFLGLSNEFCHAMETAAETERGAFIDTMLRLLPRLYISASDMPEPLMLTGDEYVTPYLDEEYYDAVRRAVEGLLGEDDTYLEVFEDDMKYSDTPIAVSLSESLTDIFQVLYNMLETVKDAPGDVVAECLGVVKEDFGSNWSQTLCNALRALNAVKYDYLP